MIPAVDRLVARHPDLLDRLRGHRLALPAESAPEPTYIEVTEAPIEEDNPYAGVFVDEDDPLAILREEPSFVTAPETFTPEALVAERIVPHETPALPNQIDLWLSASEEALGQALKALLGLGRPVVPDHTPLALVNGTPGRIYWWQRHQGQQSVDATLELADVRSLGEALLQARLKKALVVATHAHRRAHPDRMVLCLPPLRRLAVEELTPWWPANFTTRRVVWFEPCAGSIASETARRFLKELSAEHPVHVVMLDLLRAHSHAHGLDANPAMVSAARQLARFSGKDFAPWLHLAP